MKRGEGELNKKKTRMKNVHRNTVRGVRKRKKERVKGRRIERERERESENKEG